MPSKSSARRQRAGRYVMFGSLCVFAAIQFFSTDPPSWGVTAGWEAGTALIFGPGAWVARDRVPEERRETLAYVAGGGVILLASVWLGIALAFVPELFPYGPGVHAGVALGILVVLLAERTVVPERLRGAEI